jgi:hypothetical protein
MPHFDRSIDHQQRNDCIAFDALMLAASPFRLLFFLAHLFSTWGARCRQKSGCKPEWRVDVDGRTQPLRSPRVSKLIPTLDAQHTDCTINTTDQPTTGDTDDDDKRNDD